MLRKSLSGQRSESQDWLGLTEIETGGLAPNGQRDRTSGAEPPVETSGDKENRTKRALMPPTIAKELPPERPFSSA